MFIIEHQEKAILNQCEKKYEQKIDEYQKNLELSFLENENMKSELTKLKEAKESNERTANELVTSLKQDFEKQIETLKIQNVELQEYCSLALFSFSSFQLSLLLDNLTTNELTKKGQEIAEYRSYVNQLNKDIEELHRENESKTKKITELKTELDQNYQTNTQVNNIQTQYEQTQNEFIQCVGCNIF